MRLATKIILTIILAVIAIGLLVGRFWDLLSSPFATAEKGTTDPYNITKVRPQSKYTVNIIKTKMKFNSQTISRYVYSNSHNVIYPAGQPIVLAAGKQVTVNVKNASGTATNVHWHGLTIPIIWTGHSIRLIMAQAKLSYLHQQRREHIGITRIIVLLRRKLGRGCLDL